MVESYYGFVGIGHYLFNNTKSKTSIIMKSISVCSTKEDPKMPKAAAILEGDVKNEFQK